VGCLGWCAGNEGGGGGAGIAGGRARGVFVFSGERDQVGSASWSCVREGVI